MTVKGKINSFYYQFIQWMVIVALGLIAINHFVFGNWSLTETILYSLIPIGLYLIQKRRGRPMFSMDSEGEVLTVENRDYNLISTVPKVTKKIEFPKRKLDNYKVQNNLIGKRLIFLIESKRTNITKQVFDITYLSKEDVQKVKDILDEIVVDNSKSET